MLGRFALLQKLDIFGVAPSIQFNGGSKSYSQFGLVYTLITGAFVIWAIIFTSQDFVHRTNPAIVTTTLYGATVDEDIVFNHELFQLGFGIYENFALGNYFIDPSIYTITARMGLFTYYDDGTTILSFTPLNIEPCKKSSFDGNVAYYDSQYCLSKKQDHFDKLFTRAEDDTFIQVDFHLCNNITSGGICAPEEVIKKWITDSDVMTTFKQSTTIASDFKEPISHFYTDQWQGLLLDKTKSVKLMIDVVDFTSDDGWLFQSEETKTILNFNPIVGDTLERREENLFATFIIANSGNKIVYKRIYMKIQDVLAQVSGLAGAAALALGLLAQPFAELKMYEKAVKDIYKINMKKKKNSKAPSRKISKLPSKKDFPVSNNDQSSLSPELDETTKAHLKSEEGLLHLPSRRKFNSAKVAPLRSMKSMQPEDIIQITDPMNNSISSPEKPKLENNFVIEEDLNATVAQKDTGPHVSEKEIDTDRSKPAHDHVEIGSPVVAPVDLEKETPLDIEESDETTDHELPEVGYFEWLLSPIRFSPQINVLKQGRDEINKYLDLLVLVKKMREVEKLETCLMKTEERVLFNNVKQPSLSIDAEKGKKDKKERQVQVTDWLNVSEPPGSVAQVDQAYLNVKIADHKTRFSERLLALYEQDKTDLKAPDASGLLEISKDQVLDKIM